MNIKFVLLFIALTTIVIASSQNNSAIDSLENILRTAKADTVKVNCLNSLSSEYRNISDYEMSMQYAESALELADNTPLNLLNHSTILSIFNTSLNPEVP